MAFKMKGSSLYGKLNLNRGGQASMPDGKAKSSAFQMDKKSPMEKGKTSKIGKLKALGKGISAAWRASATENVGDSIWHGRQAYKKAKKESRDADQKNNKK